MDALASKNKQKTITPCPIKDAVARKKILLVDTMMRTGSSLR